MSFEANLQSADSNTAFIIRLIADCSDMFGTRFEILFILSVGSVHDIQLFFGTKGLKSVITIVEQKVVVAIFCSTIYLFQP